MLKQLGKLIWRQSRDIYVLNYPSHTLYEIFTNQGTLRIIHERETDRFEVIDSKATPKELNVRLRSDPDLE